MKNLTYLTWENFKNTVIVPRQQRVHSITSSPIIQIYSDGISRKIGIWIEIPSNVLIPAEYHGLAFIKIQKIYKDEKMFLEVSTDSELLYRQFYYFSIAVAESVIVEKNTPTQAVGKELNCFTELFESVPVLGIERQIGLLGELIFLQYLIEKYGEIALDSWIGSMGEPHDFRINNREFEVKTTSKTKRVHTINGENQLTPSNGCSLYLVSIMLGPPGSGDGRSLADQVNYLLERLVSNNTGKIKFQSALQSLGYKNTDNIHYFRKFILRSPIALVPIDEFFPAITKPFVHKMLGEKSSRLEAFQYDVNIEGLEYYENSVQFDAAIPDITKKE